jgi:hypothetical protein
MTRGKFGRTVAVSAQFAVLITTLGCESGPATGPTAVPTGPSSLRDTFTVPPQSTPRQSGALGGTVTINGEARPIVFVALQSGRAFDTTIANGSWEWGTVPAGDHVVVIKTPPGLTCDATSKSATVTKDHRTVVNFACVGDVKGSIQGFALHEFGTAAAARITLTGPVNRETISNPDGFFAFEDLPRGEYLLGWCKDPVKASVRDGATAFAMVDCS